MAFSGVIADKSLVDNGINAHSAEVSRTTPLLPDGRVLQSGMGADFGSVPDETSAEFFSPPHLFKGPRLTITSAPAQVQYGKNFTVTTRDAASTSSVVLIRKGAAPHSFDQATWFVPVLFLQVESGLSITTPAKETLPHRAITCHSL